MSVTILLSPSLSRFFLFQAGFSFYQVSQGCFRGSGVYFGDLCAQLFSNWRLESVFCRCDMYSGGMVLTAWKAILFWYGGDRFWIVVFSFLSFSSQAFLIQPDSVVRVCAFLGCGTIVSALERGETLLCRVVSCFWVFKESNWMESFSKGLQSLQLKFRVCSTWIPCAVFEKQICQSLARSSAQKIPS